MCGHLSLHIAELLQQRHFHLNDSYTVLILTLILSEISITCHMEQVIDISQVEEYNPADTLETSFIHIR